MNRKWYVLFSIMLVAMLALAACGGGASDSASEPEPAADVEEVATAAPEQEAAADEAVATEEAAGEEEAPAEEAAAADEASADASGEPVTLTMIGAGPGAELSSLRSRSISSWKRIRTSPSITSKVRFPPLIVMVSICRPSRPSRPTLTS